MTRWKASGIHLTLSALIGLTAFCLLYFVYYPQPFFKAAGADQLVMILLGVDVVLGPLLTLAVFKSGKKSLKFDLSVIALLQMGALVYGLYVMWVARPVYIVAVVDRLEIVYANELEPERLAEAELAEYRKMPMWGPKLITTRRPTPGKEQEQMMDAVFSGLDVQHFPKFYASADANALRKFLQKAKELSSLPKNTQKVIQAYLQKRDLTGDFVAVPMKGRTEEFTVIFDRSSAKMVGALQVSSWE
jgi:hypothetical protein